MIYAKTEGSDKMIIKGNNFGKQSTFAVPHVLYESMNNADGSIQSYEANSCAISVDHEEITCLTVEGAGESYSLSVTIDEQRSVVATSSYNLPEIYRITGPGSTNEMGMATKLYTCMAKILDLPLRCRFWNMFHTAKTGDEYHAKCNHLSHTLVHCLTSPGAGENLYWQITVLKLTSMIQSMPLRHMPPH